MAPNTLSASPTGAEVMQYIFHHSVVVILSTLVVLIVVFLLALPTAFTESRLGLKRRYRDVATVLACAFTFLGVIAIIETWWRIFAWTGGLTGADADVVEETTMPFVVCELVAGLLMLGLLILWGQIRAPLRVRGIGKSPFSVLLTALLWLIAAWLTTVAQRGRVDDFQNRKGDDDAGESELRKLIALCHGHFVLAFAQVTAVLLYLVATFSQDEPQAWDSSISASV
ncbi:MAG: hypothetical protein M1832_001447 [Thelocarpon impressellum]|nr:MAG: hypothetical protein M1832_001447 [Thelocarpon impressellum]